MIEKTISPENSSEFERWDIDVLKKTKDRADIKADILRALNAGDIDATTEALKEAGYYLLDLENADESRKISFEGNENHGPKYWKRVQLPDIINNKHIGRDHIIYLDSVDRIGITKRGGKFVVNIVGPPRPKSARKWDMVEQAYDTIYGVDGNPQKSLIPERLLHLIENLDKSKTAGSNK